MNSTTDRHWSRYYTQGKDFKLIAAHTIDNFLHYRDPAAPKTCLDIGCGTGQLGRELWHRGYSVIGIDIAAEAIERARSLTKLPEGLIYQHFDIEQDDSTTLALQPYGLIVCKFVYAFMQDKSAFLQRVASLLDSNGIFVVITPLAEYVLPEKRDIAVGEQELALLRQYFRQLAWYRVKGDGYFIGRYAAYPK